MKLLFIGMILVPFIFSESAYAHAAKHDYKKNNTSAYLDIVPVILAAQLHAFSTSILATHYIGLKRQQNPKNITAATAAWFFSLYYGLLKWNDFKQRYTQKVKKKNRYKNINKQMHRGQETAQTAT